MGKVTGFLEIERKDRGYEKPEARLKNNRAAGELKLTAEDLKLRGAAGLEPLNYPYWHQCASAANRLGPADLTLHAPHIARSKPIW